MWEVIWKSLAVGVVAGLAVGVGKAHGVVPAKQVDDAFENFLQWTFSPSAKK